MRRILVPVILALVVAALAATAAFAGDDTTSFKMVRSKAAVDDNCLKGAKAQVDVRTTSTAQQVLDVTLKTRPRTRSSSCSSPSSLTNPLASPGTSQTSIPTTRAKVRYAPEASSAKSCLQLLLAA